jgi:hypothetical protein
MSIASNLEIKRKQVTLSRLQAGAMEIELSIDEAMANIERLEKNLSANKEKQSEVMIEIEVLKSGTVVPIGQ